MKKNSNYYIDPKEFEMEMLKFRKAKKASERLGELFLILAKNIVEKGNFRNYTYKDDLISNAVYHLIAYAYNYDPQNKKSNAFNYASQIAFNGAVQIIKAEKKQSLIKDTVWKARLDSDEHGDTTDVDAKINLHKIANNKFNTTKKYEYL